MWNNYVDILRKREDITEKELFEIAENDIEQANQVHHRYKLVVDLFIFPISWGSLFSFK